MSKLHSNKYLNEFALKICIHDKGCHIKMRLDKLMQGNRLRALLTKKRCT